MPSKHPKQNGFQRMRHFIETRELQLRPAERVSKSWTQIPEIRADFRPVLRFDFKFERIPHSEGWPKIWELKSKSFSFRQKLSEWWQSEENHFLITFWFILLNWKSEWKRGFAGEIQISVSERLELKASLNLEGPANSAGALLWERCSGCFVRSIGHCKTLSWLKVSKLLIQRRNASAWPYLPAK